MKFRAPASLYLRRAQLVLMLAGLIPTILLVATGIILVAAGSGSVAIITGALVLALCTSLVTGYILSSILLSRGASLARVQNDFLSSVSHELRTPITSIRMFLDTLRTDRVTDPKERRSCLEIMEREMARLDGLVAKLLELSKIEAGRQLFERKPVQVDDVVRDAIDAFGAVTLGQEVAVSVEVERDLAVVGDRGALTQALLNLLTNAWKYTPPEDKRIAVRARASGRRHVEIVVEDNGPGVPADEKRLIFEAFERGRAAIDSRTAGSGLGLAIVRAIIHSHKGTVELSSGGAPDRGARFRIVLPRHTPLVHR